MTTRTPVRKVLRSMRLPNVSRRFVSVVAMSGMVLATIPSAGQQGLPQPKVGGASTYDNSTSLSGNNATAGGGSGRRPLSSVSAIPEDFSTLKLAPGFLLSMEVYDAPEFSADLRVDAQGDVKVPMAGSVHVGGDTLTEAANQISQKLESAKILNDPQVNLNVTQYAGMSVNILGEVHNPGRIELLAPHDLSEIIAMAGGETQYAGNTVEIRHAGAASQRELLRYTRDVNDSVLTNTLVQPGDTVTVRRAGIVYVLGSVNRPGGYIMQEDGELSLTQALALAYGRAFRPRSGQCGLSASCRTVG